MSNSNLSASTAVCFESLLQSLNVFAFAVSSFSCAHSCIGYTLDFSYLYAYVLLSVYIPCSLFVYGNCCPLLFIIFICPSPVPSISHTSYPVFFELIVFMKREE